MTSTNFPEGHVLTTVNGWTVTIAEDGSDGEDILLLARNGKNEDRYATARFDANGLAVSEFMDPDGRALPDDTRQPLYDAVIAALEV